MIPLIGGALATLFVSMSDSYYKKSLELGNISNLMFKFYIFFIGPFIYGMLTYIYGFNSAIITDFLYFSLLIFTCWVRIGNTAIFTYVYKRTKASEILPYNNLDKLFIVILGFFLYRGIPGQETSYVTLSITVATIFITLFFTVDFKNFKIPKTLGLIFLNNLIRATNFVIVGYILLKYSAITYGGLNIVIEFFSYIIICLIIKDSFKSLFTQTKPFYKARFTSVLLGQSAFILGLFIVESVGVIIMSLLGFLGLFFSIISMKFILGDTPSKKQILLGFIIIFMIGIGYYFK
ncbi:hypothetical protein OAN96_01525 [Candidatus Gracilibacteria bacterium]|nr:hypothetical protein [Candidatus Gracilibacteria bacterium]